MLVSMRGRFFAAKALLILIAIDVWTPIKLYGDLFRNGTTGRISFWTSLVVVTLLVGALLWLTMRLGRLVGREFR
jgi:hypothetical protein